jgi:phenylpropionate dioxygenase-like ring-hydroxylating dioxygenase large terminal subunit
MLVTQQPVFRKFWHAVMPLSMLHPAPNRSRCWARRSCCSWTRRASRLRCATAAATARRKLSSWCVDAQGRPACNGHIQCGYHGWTYDGRGKRHPHSAVRRGPRHAADYKTPAYHCTAKLRLCLGGAGRADRDIPDMPEFSNPAWRTIFQFYETWATSPVRALENSFDNSHFSFVHRATFGVPDAAQPSKYELVERDTGFYAETVIAAANPPVPPASAVCSDAVTTRHMRNAYFLPFSRRLDIEYPSGVRHVIINCFTPD